MAIRRAADHHGGLAEAVDFAAPWALNMQQHHAFDQGFAHRDSTRKDRRKLTQARPGLKRALNFDRDPGMQSPGIL